MDRMQKFYHRIPGAVVDGKAYMWAFKAYGSS